MQYEYYYEGIVVKDLQDLRNRVITSSVVGTVTGTSSGSAGITSVAFSAPLSTTNKTRLLTFIRSISASATLIREEVLT